MKRIQLTVAITVEVPDDTPISTLCCHIPRETFRLECPNVPHTFIDHETVNVEEIPTDA